VRLSGLTVSGLSYFFNVSSTPDFEKRSNLRLNQGSRSKSCSNFVRSIVLKTLTFSKTTNSDNLFTDLSFEI